MSIHVQGIVKSFGAERVLNSVDLLIPDGSLTALLGPSGCGKTTLLRVIAGLERPEQGTVRIHGIDVSQIHARSRQVGFVFQHYALFKHMTVSENIAFPMKVRKRPRSEIQNLVDELIQLVHLEGHEDHFPSELSGGQRQRVALARALAARPNVLLLDEPFGALDASVRRDLRRWLRRLHQEIRVTTAFVTHDQEEALEVADRVVVMNQGRIEQEGTPDEIFEHPKTPFVMRFLENVNIFHGRVEGGSAYLGPLKMEYPDHPHPESIPAAGYARTHDLDLAREDHGGGGFWAKLHHISVMGAVVKLELMDHQGLIFHVEVARERYLQLAPQVGESFYLRPRQMKVFVESC